MRSRVLVLGRGMTEDRGMTVLQKSLQSPNTVDRALGWLQDGPRMAQGWSWDGLGMAPGWPWDGPGMGLDELGMEPG